MIPDNKDTRKIAIYARKSKVTESGKSIENQITKCKAYAMYKYEASEEDILVYPDEGKSGFYADRPSYLEMLKDIRENKIKIVICYKFDRISRRTFDLLNLVEDLNNKKIAFVSCTDEIDTQSKNGKLIMAMLASIAEFERDVIAERVTDNLYELAKEGRWLGGVTPTGYYSKQEVIRVGNRKTTINHLEPLPDEQIVVKRIFSLYLKERSLAKVRDHLNSSGIRTKTRAEHTNISVRDILDNVVYALADKDMYDYFTSLDLDIYAEESDFDGFRGIMAYGKTEQTKEKSDESTLVNPKYVKKSTKRDMSDWVIAVGEHAGVIPGKDWIKAQAILNENRDKYARPNDTSKSILSGLVECPQCGSPMYVRSNSGRYTKDGQLQFRYVCSKKYRDNSACPNARDVNGNELDQFVIDEICKMSEPDNQYYQRLSESRKLVAFKTAEEEKEIIELKRTLGRIGSDLESQAVNLRTAPESVKKAIFADIETLTGERDEKIKRLSVLEEAVKHKEQQLQDIEKAKEIIFSFPRLVENISFQQKCELVKRIVERVIVLDETVHIFLIGSSVSSPFMTATVCEDMCQRGKHSKCYSALIDTGTFVYHNGKILLHVVVPRRSLPPDATVGQRIRYYRQTRSLTIEQLGSLSSLSRHAIMDYEAGTTEPQPSDLDKIAGVLNIPADKLYDDYYRFLAYPFSDLVRQSRESRKLTQREFGELLGLGRRAVERWEHGKNRVSRSLWEMMKARVLI